MDRRARCLRTVDVEGGSCVDNTGNSTVVLSVRHITWSSNKRATHNGVGDRACDTQRTRRRETSGREQRACVAIQWWSVAIENCVKGLCVSCDLYALGSVYFCEIDHVVDFTRRTRQLIAYRQDVVYWTLSSK